MLREFKQTLYTIGPRDPETETELGLSVSSEGTGQQWPAEGAPGATDLGVS